MAEDWLGLDSRVVAVTGGGSGIGRQVCLELAAAGAIPVALDANEGGAQETAAMVTATGAEGTAHGVDVSNREAVKSALEQAVADFGPLHGVVNAAGVMRAGSLADLSLEDWEFVLRINLTGCLVVAQEAQRLMTEGGSMVHISSISGSFPQPTSGAYSSSKAGLKMLSRELAFEFGERGIRSNVVSPGLVRTAMSEAFYQAPGVREAREKAVPLQRIAAPSDMADVVLFLLSNRSSYVTGQDIVVDGGFSQALMSFIPRPGYGS